MNQSLLKSQQLWIQEELKRCIEFWLKHGMDSVHGGVCTCLDREGKIYSTDKSVWMQGRCAWTFSYLCRQYGVRREWLDAAESCLEFLEKYCINRQEGNRMYFTVTADGKPLEFPGYCFSEDFYAIANAEYAALTGDQTCMQRARDMYELTRRLQSEPQPYRTLGNPMTYLNTSEVMLRCDPGSASVYDQRARQCVLDILRYHHKPGLRCTLEKVGPDGEVTGRLVNPGHMFESSWFMMEYANRSGDTEVLEKSREMFDFALDIGWDPEYEGFFCGAFNPSETEHTMKQWWPHNEMLIAALMIFRDTENVEYYKWFTKVLEYCKRVFSDPQYGEWYGELHRDGNPAIPPAKGGIYKGPFHLPRMLIIVDKMITRLLQVGGRLR
jgi:N-acylglucosamine 2-epimerase